MSSKEIKEEVKCSLCKGMFDESEMITDDLCETCDPQINGAKYQKMDYGSDSESE